MTQGVWDMEGSDCIRNKKTQDEWERKQKEKKQRETEKKWSAYLEQCDTRCVRCGRMRRSHPRTLELTKLVRCHRWKCETDVKAENNTWETSTYSKYLNWFAQFPCSCIASSHSWRPYLLNPWSSILANLELTNPPLFLVLFFYSLYFLSKSSCLFWLLCLP
jgi:hypothetical protein